MGESAARDKGVLRKERISDGWFHSFMERLPQLRLCKGDRASFVHMNAMMRKQELDNYFVTLKNIMVEHDLLSKPEQLYNVDEFGIPLTSENSYLLRHTYWKCISLSKQNRGKFYQATLN